MQPEREKEQNNKRRGERFIVGSWLVGFLEAIIIDQLKIPLGNE